MEKNIIKLIHQYLQSIDSQLFRQCSKYINKHMSSVYFSNIIFNVTKINKNNKHHFRSIVHKYNLTINIKYVSNLKEICYLNTFNIKTLNFMIDTRCIYKEYLIPSTVKELSNYFPLNLNNMLLLKKLPSLQTIKFNAWTNMQISKKNLPKTIKYLQLGRDFIGKIISLPNNLHTLIFGEQYNRIIPKNIFPTSLTKLEFGDSFNQPIDLPSNLLELTFGYDFNNTIKNFPITLEKLIFGNDFNMVFDENISLPSLKILIFKNNFNQAIPKGMLCNLPFLCVNDKYDKKIDILTCMSFELFDQLINTELKKIHYECNKNIKIFYNINCKIDNKLVKILIDIIVNEDFNFFFRGIL